MKIERLVADGVEVIRSYHANGAICSEVTQRDGLPDGLTRHWYDNGVLRVVYPMRCGLIDGEVIKYAPDGRKLGSYVMSNGTGVVKEFDESGNLVVEIEFVEGRRDGREVLYVDGNPVRVRFFRNGKVVRGRK